MTKPAKLIHSIPAITIAILALMAYITPCQFMLTPHAPAHVRALYIFTHANVFHLAANLIALLRFRPRWNTCLIAWLVSFLVTYIPVIHLAMPTCGMSGFLMACFARHYVAWHRPIMQPLLANIIFILVPCVNWRIHIICFLLSYIIYDIIYTIKH